MERSGIRDGWAMNVPPYSAALHTGYDWIFQRPPSETRAFPMAHKTSSGRPPATYSDGRQIVPRHQPAGVMAACPAQAIVAHVVRDDVAEHQRPGARMLGNAAGVLPAPALSKPRRDSASCTA